MSYRLQCRDEICAAGPLVNEDLVGRTRTAAWVIDGVSGLAGGPIGGESSSAVWLAKLLDTALRRELAALRSDAEVAWESVSSELSQAFSALGATPDDVRVDCPCACLAFSSLVGDRLQISCIGDCRVIAERFDGELHVAADIRIEPFEISLLNDWVNRIGGDPDIDPKLALRKQFQAMRGCLNRDGGYWAVHPTIEWTHGLQRSVLPAFGGQTALLMSDGFYRLVNLFGAHDDRGLLGAAKHIGLRALLKDLRELEVRHSTAEYPRFKRHDDASACLIDVVAA